MQFTLLFSISYAGMCLWTNHSRPVPDPLRPVVMAVISEAKSGPLFVKKQVSADEQK